MSNRPQTLYALEDSPIGLAAWMLDHDARSQALIARVFDGQAEGLTRDDILDNVMLYWLTKTAVSSARLYWENKLEFFAIKQVAIPVAVSVFPDEIYAAPRSWTERAYKRLIHFNRLDKGGHFAAWEQTEVFVREPAHGLRQPALSAVCAPDKASPSCGALSLRVQAQGATAIESTYPALRTVLM